MFQDFLRLAIYVPIDEADDGPNLAVASAAPVQEILRVFREFEFAGRVGTYKAVVEISGGAETFVPTKDSVPVHE